MRGSVELPWEELDWTKTTPARIEADWRALLERDSEQPFRLDQAPVMRLKLVRTGPSQRRLLWTVHHLLMDGWSGRLLMREVFDACAALQSGREVETGPAVGFGEYVRWLQGPRPEDPAPTLGTSV